MRKKPVHQRVHNLRQSLQAMGHIKRLVDRNAALRRTAQEARKRAAELDAALASERRRQAALTIDVREPPNRYLGDRMMCNVVVDFYPELFYRSWARNGHAAAGEPFNVSRHAQMVAIDVAEKVRRALEDYVQPRMGCYAL